MSSARMRDGRWHDQAAGGTDVFVLSGLVEGGGVVVEGLEGLEDGAGVAEAPPAP